MEQPPNISIEEKAEDTLIPVPPLEPVDPELTTISTFAPQIEDLARGSGRATGRKAALAVIDGIMGNAANLKKFKEEMQETFNRSPVYFYETFVQPLIPKNVSLGDSNPQAIQINVVTVDAADARPRTDDSQSSPVIDVNLVERKEPS
jgi:hypothetical protein